MPDYQKQLIEDKNRKGLKRIYAKGTSTVGFVKGKQIAHQSDVVPGQLLIGVDHKEQREFLVEVIANPNPLNVTLIHYTPVYSVILKRKGLTVKPVKNGSPGAVLVTELGHKELWAAEQYAKLAA